MIGLNFSLSTKRVALNFLYFQLSEVSIRGSQIIIIPILVFFKKDLLIADISLIYYTGSLIASVFLFGMPVYLIYQKSVNAIIKAPVFSFAYFYLIIFVLLLLVGMPLAYYYHSFINQTFVNVAVGLLVGGVMLMNYLTLYMFKSLNKGLNYFIFSLFFLCGTVVLGLSLAVYFDTASFFYISYSLFLFYFLYKYIFSSKKVSGHEIKKAFNYGYVFVPGAVSIWILANFDKYILNLYVSTGELSEYIQISSLLALTIISITSLDKIYENKIFKMLSQRQAIKSTQKRFLSMYLLIIAFILVLSIVVNFIVFDSKYNYLVIFTIISSAVPFAINQINVKLLLFDKKNTLVMKNNAFSAIMTVIMVLIFVKQYLVLGAAIITFFGYTTISALNYLSLKKRK